MLLRKRLHSCGGSLVVRRFLRRDWLEETTCVDCFALLLAGPDSGQLFACPGNQGRFLNWSNGDQSKSG